MSIDILDIFFRLERVFGVVITREEYLKLVDRNDLPDVLVGDLFDLVRRTVFHAGLIDEEVDGENAVWQRFQEVISDATGIDVDEGLRDRKFIEDLGI